MLYSAFKDKRMSWLPVLLNLVDKGEIPTRWFSCLLSTYFKPIFLYITFPEWWEVIKKYEQIAVEY